MAEKATGRQKLFAKAIGISGADQMDRDDISRAFDVAKSRRSDPPNSQQLKTAKEWNIDLSRVKTASAATDVLWKAALARVYVYSVLRRLADAKWQFHEQCPISQSWINKTAVELSNDWNRAETIAEMDNAMSGTKGDSWIRFGNRQAETAAFKFVEAAAQRDSLIEQLAAARPLSAPQGGNRKSEAGCATMVFLIILAGAVPFAWLVSRLA